MRYFRVEYVCVKGRGARLVGGKSPEAAESALREILEKEHPSGVHAEPMEKSETEERLSCRILVIEEI